MAKKKSKPASGPKLPKHIAGVKVPKALREPGGRLLAAVSDPVMMELAAAALTAAVASWAEKLERRLAETARRSAPPEA